MAVSPDGSTLYVTNYDGGLSVISTATSTITATIPVGNSPVAVAATVVPPAAPGTGTVADISPP